MGTRSGTFALVAAGAALLLPSAAAGRESRPLEILADTGINGASYRIDLTRRTSGRRISVCLTLRVRSERKVLLAKRRRCTEGPGFEYASPSLLVTDERDPDNAPLVFGFAAPGLGSVQVPVAGDRAPVRAKLRSVPLRLGGGLSVFVAHGLDSAPLGVRAYDRNGNPLDGVVFPPPVIERITRR
jgi:hypothetical protein